MTNVELDNNINFIFMRDQNLPPLRNNMLIGEITSTLSSWGIKIRHPLWPICWMVVITATLSSWGIKIRKAGHQLQANVQVAANMFETCFRWPQKTEPNDTKHQQNPTNRYKSCFVPRTEVFVAHSWRFIFFSRLAKIVELQGALGIVVCLRH